MHQRGSLDFNLLLNLAHPPYLILCFLALFLNLFLNNYRWVVLMRGQGFTLGIRETLPLSFIGLFFNYAMPGGVGGDLVKGYYIMQEYPDRRTAAAASVLIDRLVGFWGMVLMSMVAMLVNIKMILSRAELISLALGVLALFFIFAVIFAVSFSRRIYTHPVVNLIISNLPGEKVIRKIYDAFHSYRSAPKEFLTACWVTILSHLTMLAFFVFIGWALDFEDVSIWTYAFAAPLGIIATALPIAPAGIGVGQAVFLVLFNWSLGHDSPLGPSLITAHQLVTFILGLVGAFFYFKRKRPDLKEVTA